METLRQDLNTIRHLLSTLPMITMSFGFPPVSQALQVTPVMLSRYHFSVACVWVATLHVCLTIAQCIIVILELSSTIVLRLVYVCTSIVVCAFQNNLFYGHWCEDVSHPLVLELQTVVSCWVDAGNWTQVLCENQCSNCWATFLSLVCPF